MKLINCKMSSNIRSFGYNEKRKILRIVFSSGSVYDYYNVQKQLFDLFEWVDKTKLSVGSFFIGHIKNKHKFLKH